MVYDELYAYIALQNGETKNNRRQIDDYNDDIRKKKKPECLNFPDSLLSVR